MRNMQLWHKVVLGMLLGIICGVLLDGHPEAIACFAQLGKVFSSMLKMIVIPIVFFTILSGLISINDVDTFGRLGLRSLLIYSSTTIFAVLIGIAFTYIFEPGVGISIPLSTTSSLPATAPRTLSDIAVNIIPANPIAAMAEGNTLQVVVFAFFTGFALISIGEKGKEVRNFVNSATALIFKMVEIVIAVTPYGVFAIMAWVVGEHGFELMFSLAKLIGVVSGALFLQYCLFGVMLAVFAKVNPLHFYRKMLPIQTLAFATASSKATLSLAITDMQEKMGVSKRSASFVLPLGTSINMDATAIYLGVCAVFFAQLTGVQLTVAQLFTVIVTSTIGSIGAAGFPGGGLVMMSMVLSSVGLPVEGISLIIGVDRILDMCRTVINITGDCTVTVIVDKMEGSFDYNKYNQKTELALPDSSNNPEK